MCLWAIILFLLRGWSDNFLLVVLLEVPTLAHVVVGHLLTSVKLRTLHRGWSIFVCEFLGRLSRAGWLLHVHLRSLKIIINDFCVQLTQVFTFS